MVVTKTFPATAAKEVVSIDITTPPTKTAYEHGDTLNTAGMVVTATYDDTSTSAVSGYTVNYASGDYLKKDDTTATISYSGQDATVTGLTVSTKALTVSGLTATNRAYDGTTAVTLSGGSLVGVAGTETVNATMPTSGTITSADVGNDKAVSFSAVTLSGGDAANYTVTQPTVTVNITAKSITGATITLGTQATYDGNAHDVVITSVGIDGLPPTYDITSGGSATNVEDTTLTLTGNGNFSGTATTTWKLVKATPAPGDFDITTLSTVDYDGSAKTVNAPTLKSGKTGAGAVTVKYNGSAIAPTNADSYTVTFDVAEGTNFNAANGLAIGTLTINKIAYDGTTTASATVRSGEMTTNATLTLPTLPVGASYGTVSTSGALIDGTPAVSGTTLTYSTTSQTDGTSGTITVAVTGATNYNDYSVVVTVTAKDKDPAGVTITEGSTLTKTYGDAAVTLYGTVTAAGTNGAWTWTSSDTNVATVTDAGVVTIVGQGSSTITAKYESDTTVGEATLSLSVNKKDVTITGLSAQNKEYDRTTNATVTGTAAISGKVGNDDVTVSAGTASFANKTVGTGKTVTFSGYSLGGTAAGNYNLTAQPASVTANITAKPVTATVTATDRDYATGSKTVVLVAGTVTGAITGDTVTVDASGATGTMADENAGSGKAVIVTGVKLGGTDAANYTLSAQPAGVTVTINQIAYDGAALTAEKSVLINKAQTGVEVDLASLVSGITGATLISASETSDTDDIIDNVTVSGSKVTFDIASVSETSKTASITASFTATNYTGVTATITVTTVDKSEAGVTVTGVPTEAKIYGDADFALTASVTDAGEGTGVWTWTSSDDTVLSVTGSGTSATVSILKAGSATITAHYESDTTMDEAVTATITVNKATITITAKDQTIYVNGTVPDLTAPVEGTHYTVTGLKGGDTLGGTLAMEYQEGGASATPDNTKAGTYDIVVSGATADTDKYSAITFMKGTLTIRNRPSPSTPTETTVTIPVSSESDTVHVEVTVSGDNATVKALSDEDIDKIITSEDEQEDVIFDLSSLGDGVSTVNIPSESFAKVADALEQRRGDDTITIKTSTGEAQFDETAVHVIADQAKGGHVALTFENTGTEKLNVAQKAALAGKELLGNYELTLIVNGTIVSDFDGGTVKLTIPLTPADEKQGNYYRVYYMADNGNTERMPTSYTNNMIVFTTTHFSDYVLAYEVRPFVDVPESWYYDAVYYSYDNGYFYGTSNDHFTPNGTMTRAMFATVLYRIAGEPEVTGTNPFTDVQEGKWYTDAIIWASGEKIIKGYGNGKFGTNDPVTREQMVTLFWRYNGRPTVENADLSKFIDTDKIGGWAQQAMEWAVSVGIISGKGNGILDPKGTAKRSEVAQIVMNYDRKMK